MENKQNKANGLGDKLKSNKFKHGTMATVFTLVFIAIIIALNIVVSALADRFPSMNMDLTAEGLNSLSETAVEAANKVQTDTEICIVGKEDAIRGDMIFTQYSLKYSQVANLADKMQEKNGKIKVRFIDPDLDPKFIAEYPDDNLQAGAIVVRTEKRAKILQVTDMFSIQQNQEDGTVKQFSMADGAIANAVHLVNLESVPVIAVATGHSEILAAEDRATFDQLMKDNGFDVKEFNLLTEEVPTEAQVVMLAAPNTDYTKEEITKLETFLKESENSRSLFVTAHPTQSPENLKNFYTFLEDWGVKINQGIVLESDNAKALSGNPSYFFSESVGEMFKENSYTNLLTAMSSPIELLFKANNDISTYALIQSSDTAYITEDGELKENPETGVHVLASISQRVETIDNKPIRSNVIVMGNTMTMLGNFLGGSSFGNRQYVTDLLKYATGTTDTSVGLYVQSTETNTIDITATAGVIDFVGLILLTIIVPVAILIAGLVIFLKRRHL